MVPGFSSMVLGARTQLTSGELKKRKGNSGGGTETSYYVFQEDEFSTRTGSKTRNHPNILSKAVAGRKSPE
jgi:hypothetical protein